MKRSILPILVLVLLTLAISPASLADQETFVGDWVCVAVDLGDGNRQTTYEGTQVAELMKLQFAKDGTLLVISMGQTIPGTWQGDSAGVSAIIDGQAVSFAHKDGQLSNESNGVTVYLEKVKPEPKSGGLLSLIKGGKYAGEWVAAAVDTGDGALHDQMQGIKVSELLAFRINQGGTLTMTSQGQAYDGTWQEIDGGVRVTLDNEVTDMLLQAEWLVAETEGATIYFVRPGQKGPTLGKTFTFDGTWKAVRYQTMGYTFDAAMLFPDGCIVTLREDGTGEAFITDSYKETITWSVQDGVLFLSGSYVFADPAWDAEKAELTLSYGGGAVQVIFQKNEEVSDPSPAPSPTLTPTLAPTPVPTSSPTPTPKTNASPTIPNEPQQCKTAMFSATLPVGWVENAGWHYDSDTYCAVRYDLMDGNGSAIASISLSASNEGVDTYRKKVKALLEYIVKAGRTELEQETVGGIAFSLASYENWGWNYTEYAARVPESRVTLLITLERPENIGGDLRAILESIAYTLPVLTPPNVDPPLPEEGTPYIPATAAVTTGDVTLSAVWLPIDPSVALDSIFNNQIALEGNRLYALAGKKLYAYTVSDGRLTPDPSYDSGVFQLVNECAYLSNPKDGPLYVSGGIFNVLTVKDGRILQEYNLSGSLVMHPGGEWGMTFWANADPMLVRVSGDKLTAEPWVLTNISDSGKRQGRFSSISCLAISGTHVYVAGVDAENGNAQRIAVYDLAGKELFDFGGTDWTAPDAFGSVTGIVETSQGILVLDGNNRVFKLFAQDGTFLGSVDSDALLGTDYPWLFSMIPTSDGVLVAAAQKRADESCDELLIFSITGF